MLAGLLAGVGGSAPANAVQATGHEVAAWSNGWSWTYATSFRYVADGTDVTINENVTYSVVGPETFNGYDAYRLNINGTITGGSGSTVVDGVGTAQLKNFSGTVNGHRYVRRSDLAVLQEFQHQHLVGTASVGIISTGITADIDLTLTPSPSWKTHDFPLNAGLRRRLARRLGLLALQRDAALRRSRERQLGHDQRRWQPEPGDRPDLCGQR
jgi:hypothetical protein